MYRGEAETNLAVIAELKFPGVIRDQMTWTLNFVVGSWGRLRVSTLPSSQAVTRFEATLRDTSACPDHAAQRQSIPDLYDHSDAVPSRQGVFEIQV